jgi:hypothetical protein
MHIGGTTARMVSEINSLRAPRWAEREGDIATVPKNTNRLWTPEEDRLLKSMIESSNAIHSIAAKLQRSVSAVSNGLVRSSMRNTRRTACWNCASSIPATLMTRTENREALFQWRKCAACFISDSPWRSAAASRFSARD